MDSGQNQSNRPKLDHTKKFDTTQNVEVALPKTGLLDRGTPRPWRIGLFIPNMQVELVVDLTDELSIGRSNSDFESFKGIDLSPFNGYELGVSRRHAVLALKNERVVIIDNESANGTFLNDDRIEPNRPYPVRNGDRLRFGMLDMKVGLLMNPIELG